MSAARDAEAELVSIVAWGGMTSLVYVLVVDDEPLICGVVEDALEEAGYAVHLAGDATAALAIIASADATVHALVTDVNLGPGSGSGWEIARFSREHAADLPVVYMTGDSASEWTSQGVPNSILITKPFAINQVVTAVSQLLNAHGADPAQ